MAGLQDLGVRLAELLDIPESQACEIASRIQPTFEVESIVGIPSTRVSGLIGAPSQGTANQGAVGGELSQAQLFNPAGSGVLVFIDKVIVSVGATAGVTFREFTTGLTTVQTTKAFVDFRRAGAPAAQMRVDTAVAGFGNELGLIDFQALGPLTFGLKIVMDEGQGFGVQNMTLNRQIIAWWFWREVTKD